MQLAHNLESAAWVGPHQDLLLLGGWAIEPGGTPLAAMRIVAAGVRTTGYYGLRRPDVARAFGDSAEGVFTGFSVLAKVARTDFPVAIEFQTQSGTWEQVATVDLGQVAEGARSELPAVEAAGWPSSTALPARADSRPVLFVGHNFAAAGAQLLLLRLESWLEAQGGVAFETLLAVPRLSASTATRPEREILAGYEAAGPVHFISDLTQAPENLAQIRQGKYRLIYANTATLGWLLPSLQPHATPVVSHCHELGFWLQHRTGLPAVARQVSATHHYIACANAVRDCLVTLAQVPPAAISVIHACGSTARAQAARQQVTRAAARQELQIPEDAFVVAACGTFDWRKGAELFAPICVATRRHLAGRPFRAFWIGSTGTDLIRDQCEYEIRAAGLGGEVFLLGQQPDPLRWMIAADCFALPSREDPFPMVMLEAGALGLPVVGFEGSGGVAEFVDGDAGRLVPYLDVEAFGAALAALANDPAAARRMGAAAERRASTLFDEERSFTLIRDLIGKLSSR